MSSSRLRRHLTIRNLPPDLARALTSERQRRATSLNQTVIDLLRTSLGLSGQGPPRNGLERLAGGWEDEDLQEFEQATALFESTDEEVWR